MSEENRKLPKNIIRHPKSGILYLDKEYAGKRLRDSLRTKNVELAKKRRDEKIKAFIKAQEEGNWQALDKTRTRKTYASIGQVLPHFEAFAALTGIEHSTLISYKGKLRRCLERCGHSKWLDVSTGELTGDLADRYVESWLIERAKEIKADPRVHQATVNMAQGQLQNAAAIFSRKALRYYERQKLKLPANLDRFGPSVLYKKRERGYQLPAVDLIEKTLSGGYELQGPLWMVFVGAFDLGCRGDDLASARLDWFVRDGEGNAYLEVPAHMTKGNRLHRKPCPAPLYAAIQAECSDREYLLPGWSEDERLSMVQRGAFPGWMRGLGWQTNLLAHELRKLRACYEYYHGGGPVSAKQIMGHSTIATTEKSYAGALGVPPELHKWFTYWNSETQTEAKEA